MATDETPIFIPFPSPTGPKCASGTEQYTDCFWQIPSRKVFRRRVFLMQSEVDLSRINLTKSPFKPYFTT